MDVGAGVFLLRSVGRLQDEDGLSGEEDTGGVKELMELFSIVLLNRIVRGKVAHGVSREEDQVVGEDAGPDGGCELGKLLVRWLG